MFKRKFRKLMRDPKSFFADMAIKRRHSIDALKPKEINGHYQYTIVSAVYNVGRYLDEYITSVTKQRLDFKKHIHLILVDDGSTDDSAAIIKKWQKKYPDNIQYLYKENGGQASARNLGMQHVNTEWVTFTDPDDILDQDYFYQIDLFAHKQKNNDVVMLCNNFILYFEDEKIYKDTHPLRYRFSKGDIVTPVNNLGKNMQLSASTAVFKSDIILNRNIGFSSKIKPSFEDAHFVGCYLSDFNDGNVGFVSKAKYYYRKRSDGSSTLDGAWEKKGLYDDVLVHGCIDMFNRYINTQGHVPKHIQRTVLYHLIWYFKRLVNNKHTLAFLSEGEINRFKSLVTELFTHIDVDTIMEFELAGCWFYHKVALLGLFKKIDPALQIVYIEAFDHIKGMVELRYFTRDVGLEAFNIGGVDVMPCFAKSMGHEFLGDSFVIERRIWVPISSEQQVSNATLKVSIGNMAARVSLAGKQHNNGVSYSQIASHFKSQKPNYKIDKRYQYSWLLMDRNTQADDNAEHLYRYIKNHHPEQDIYFVLESSSSDWQRLSAEGFNMLAFGSDEHEVALRSCQKIISSHIDKYVSNYFGPRSLAGRHLVFLQHGITKDNLSSWLNTKEAINCFITATPDEYHSIVSDGSPYKFTSKDVVLTGFPRHDALLRSENITERLIVIMPTWRKNLVGDVIKNGNERRINPDFMQTEYALHWFEVLHSPLLKRLVEKFDFRVAFYPHSNVAPYLDLFNVPDYIEVMSNNTTPIQQVFSRAAMMITDYSSVAFDMAILDKPNIYYQFDEESFFSGDHLYTKGYYDYRKHGFGPVVTNQQELFAELEEMLSNDGKPSEKILTRILKTFPYRDGKNCERVYQAIKELDAPRNPEIINMPILLEYAKQASKAKIWPLAEQRWSQIYALMDETHHGAACLGLATSLRNQGKFSEAWCHFDEYDARQAVRSLPLSHEAQAEKAELLMANSKWEQAECIWAELQSSGEGYTPTRHLHCQLAMEDWVGVSQQISSPTFSSLSKHEQLCCTAIIDSAKGEWQQVIELLSNMIVQFTPDELRTLKPELLLAQAYRELGEFDAAHQQLLGFEKHTKSDSTCRREIALLAFARNDFTKAYRQLAQAFPNRNDLPLSMVAIYLKSLRMAKQLDSAIDMVTWLLANHPADLNIMTEAGKIVLMAERWDMAADIWPSLIGVLDDAPYKLALALRMLGEIEPAQKYLDNSSTRPPCNMDEWILKAEVAHLNGRWQQAAMCWRELLRLYPTQAPEHCWERMQSALLLAKNDSLSGTLRPVFTQHTDNEIVSDF
ncbi:CDP-glycerol glycerophosphotransferase family protein [Aeromonas allosaccharophila]|uniref:CDP-glycerol glycerophosphotransferase family protein n=1 Tax=Aeromonas allosaccharophila TaxID=656 RepID=A0AAX3NZ28_9GAMM|nr:CDP-glycerol glycerophosphotransferase family protein [Aeromonas allosaccharophila]WED79363.1 CDP-glycerol glycerophosphotransferase family protein [Aeromonas allosaccharophila]